MEAANEGSDDMEVVVIESNRTRFPFGWYRQVILGAEVKPSKFGAGKFVTPSEEDGVILAKYSDGHFSNITWQSGSHNCLIPIKLW